MCAIAGLFPIGGPHGSEHHRIARIWSVLDRMAYRGPDGSHVSVVGNGVLGFARLAMVGGEGGNQPVWCACCETAIVCNGEIYDHEQLRRDIVGRHEIASASDCEIPAHLYRDDPTGFTSCLTGQFALAILDLREDSLVLTRDGFGIHPLYYAVTSDEVVFSSELGPLLETAPTRPTVRSESLAATLASYGPELGTTWFEGVYEVIPGSVVRIDLRTGAISEHHEVDPVAALGQAAPDHDFEHGLRSAVERRLRGRGGVGCYVSGGLDSSVVAALAVERSDSVTLFGLTFPESEKDEGKHQAALARHLGVPLVQEAVTSESLADAMPTLLRSTCGPITRIGPMAMLMLSHRVAESGYKFCLSGEGADELLLGYPVFRSMQSSERARSTEAAGTLPVFLDEAAHRWLAAAARRSAVTPPSTGHFDWLTTIQGEEIRSKLQRYLLTSQGDRASLANGVELRYPYLDQLLWVGGARYTTAERASAGSLTGAGLFDKSTLRAVAHKVLPPELAARTKQGFADPRDVSFLRFRKAGGELLDDALAPATCDRLGLFDDAVVTSLDHKVTAMAGSQRAENEALLLVASTHLVLDQIESSRAAARIRRPATISGRSISRLPPERPGVTLP